MRGLATGLVPGGWEVVFDLVEHRFIARSASAENAGFHLSPMSVSAFNAAFKDRLRAVGAPDVYHGRPNEVPHPVAFALQTDPGAYDRAAARAWWQAIVAMTPVFEEFRNGFLGHSSPVHLICGSFDLAVTRFSGRTAPLHPGGFPALPDAVTQEAYSHEVSSAGFWAGGNGADEAMFYSYAYPVPDGFADKPAGPEGAFFDANLGEFLLPYRVVARAANPRAVLLEFLSATYAAAAQTGKWDRNALDCAMGRPGMPRAL